MTNYVIFNNIAKSGSNDGLLHCFHYSRYCVKSFQLATMSAAVTCRDPSCLRVILLILITERNRELNRNRDIPHIISDKIRSLIKCTCLVNSAKDVIFFTFWSNMIVITIYLNALIKNKLIK